MSMYTRILLLCVRVCVLSEFFIRHAIFILHIFRMSLGDVLRVLRCCYNCNILMYFFAFFEIVAGLPKSFFFRVCAVDRCVKSENFLPKV